MKRDMQKFSCDLLNTILCELDEHLITCDDEIEFKYLDKVKNSISVGFVCWNNYLLRSEKNG